MKVVFMEADTLGSDVSLAQFEEFGDLVIYPQTDPAKNAERLRDADIVVANKIQMNEELLKDAANLKLICLTATGTNNLDIPYLKSRGIAGANVKGYSTESVVQHTFALLFYLYEKLRYYDEFVKSGEYSRNDIFSHFENKFHELTGKTWGIIGLGDIGRRVATVAQAFGCKVVYASTSGKNHTSDFEEVSLDELLKISDIVSIHAPLNERTRDLIGWRELNLMKPEAILLNLGRGPIVNEQALADALMGNVIGGAGLDVLTVEPMSPDNPLLGVQDSNRLIITPHIAWATIEARRRCADEVYLNIKAFLNGIERNIVTK